MEDQIKEAMIRSIELMSKVDPVPLEVKCTEEVFEALQKSEFINYKEKIDD